MPLDDVMLIKHIAANCEHKNAPATLPAQLARIGGCIDDALKALAEVLKEGEANGGKP
jgi:hypothetical protein